MHVNFGHISCSVHGPYPVILDAVLTNVALFWGLIEICMLSAVLSCILHFCLGDNLKYFFVLRHPQEVCGCNCEPGGVVAVVGSLSLSVCT